MYAQSQDDFDLVNGNYQLLPALINYLSKRHERGRGMQNARESAERARRVEIYRKQIENNGRLEFID